MEMCASIHFTERLLYDGSCCVDPLQHALRARACLQEVVDVRVMQTSFEVGEDCKIEYLQNVRQFAGDQ